VSPAPPAGAGRPAGRPPGRRPAAPPAAAPPAPPPLTSSSPKASSPSPSSPSPTTGPPPCPKQIPRSTAMAVDERETTGFFLNDPQKVDDPFPDLAYFRQHRQVYFYAPLSQWFVFCFDTASSPFPDPNL